MRSGSEHVGSSVLLLLRRTLLFKTLFMIFASSTSLPQLPTVSALSTPIPKLSWATAKLYADKRRLKVGIESPDASFRRGKNGVKGINVKENDENDLDDDVVSGHSVMQVNLLLL